MKIVLIGADGQLGTDIERVLGERHDIIPLYYPEFDVTDFSGTRNRLKRLPADVIINTAAYNLVDSAEQETAAAFELNCWAVRNLAKVCRDLDETLVHFSSDYVFGGEKSEPYVEDDCPQPLSVYGVSKLAGEQFAAAVAPRCQIIRTCGLYGTAGCWGKGTNFVDAVIARGERGEEVRVVNDQIVTPTATHELAAGVEDLIENGGHGIYHLTNQGGCSWFEFAREIFGMLGLRPEPVPIQSTDLKAAARRPRYSVLDNRRAREEGLYLLSPWRDALKEYMVRKGYLRK